MISIAVSASAITAHQCRKDNLPGVSGGQSVLLLDEITRALKKVHTGMGAEDARSILQVQALDYLPAGVAARIGGDDDIFRR